MYRRLSLQIYAALMCRDLGVLERLQEESLLLQEDTHLLRSCHAAGLNAYLKIYNRKERDQRPKH